MHSRQLTHRDIKPHNVLIVRPEHNVMRGGTSVFEEEEGGDDDDDEGLMVGGWIWVGGWVGGGELLRGHAV